MTSRNFHLEVLVQCLDVVVEFNVLIIEFMLCFWYHLHWLKSCGHFWWKILSASLFLLWRPMQVKRRRVSQRKSCRRSKEATDERWGPEFGGVWVTIEGMSKFAAVSFVSHCLFSLLSKSVDAFPTLFLSLFGDLYEGVVANKLSYQANKQTVFLSTWLLITVRLPQGPTET